MCRRDIYFKGFYKLRNKWENEKRHQQFDSIYEECLDEILENSYLPIDDIESLEWLYNRLKNCIERPEVLEWMLENYIDIIPSGYIIFDDIFSFVVHIFVSKHSYKAIYSGFTGTHLNWIYFPEFPRRIHVL